MSRNTKIELADFDNDVMYDINDFIRNFQHLGLGMTFQEVVDFFKQAGIISKEQVDEHIRNNTEKIQEICLKNHFDSINIQYLDKRKDLVGSPRERFWKAIEQQSKSSDDLLEQVIKSRNVDYNYFVEYIDRLKEKGITYLAIIQFVATNNQTKQDSNYWKSLLSSLDISIDGNTMLGTDIKRLLAALFSSQIGIKNKMSVGNKLETYEQPYLSEYARIGARSGSDEMYPSKNILSSIGFFDNEMRDDTSIAMSPAQVQAQKNEWNKQQEEFFKSDIFQHIKNM